MTLRPKGRVRVIISEEGTNDGRFGDDLVLQNAIGDSEGRNESSRIDVEVPFYGTMVCLSDFSTNMGTSRVIRTVARPIEGNDDFLVR